MNGCGCCLEECRRILKRGGHITIIIPAEYSTHARHGAALLDHFGVACDLVDPFVDEIPAVVGQEEMGVQGSR